MQAGQTMQAKRLRVFAMLVLQNNNNNNKTKLQFHIFSIQGLIIIVNEAFTRIDFQKQRGA